MGWQGMITGVGGRANGAYALSVAAATMPDMGSRAMDSVLVWLPNHVGDVVMATPALRSLRRHFAGRRITYVGRPAALAVLSGTDWADGTIPDESARRPCWRNARRLVRQIRRVGADLGVLLPNSFRSAVLARWGGVRHLVGYARDGRGWLLKHKLHPPRDERGRRKPIPTIDYYLALAAAVDAPAESRKMELLVTEEAEREAESLLVQAGAARTGPLVMLNPGAAFGPSKMWPAERFAAVADRLIERRAAQIIIHAAPAERPVAARVAAAMRGKPALNFAQREGSVPVLKSLLRRCGLLITNDTGARHVAAAFDVPVVTLFGSTDPVWAQIDYERERILRVDVPCSPCQSKTCREGRGPTFHQCMTAITPEMVLVAAEELLDTFSGPALPATGDPLRSESRGR